MKFFQQIFRKTIIVCYSGKKTNILECFQKYNKVCKIYGWIVANFFECNNSLYSIKLWNWIEEHNYSL